MLLRILCIEEFDYKSFAHANVVVVFKSLPLRAFEQESEQKTVRFKTHTQFDVRLRLDDVCRNNNNNKQLYFVFERRKKTNQMGGGIKVELWYDVCWKGDDDNCYGIWDCVAARKSIAGSAFVVCVWYARFSIKHSLKIVLLLLLSIGSKTAGTHEYSHGYFLANSAHIS